MSDSLPADVVTTLLINGVANRPQRFWAFETVTFEGQFRLGTSGPLVDVSGPTMLLQRPDGLDEPAPVALIRLSEGRYTRQATPEAPGTWQCVARCEGPTSSVAVRSFFIAPLPAGGPRPPMQLDFSTPQNSGLLLLL
jgi:hypothetical protein